MPAHAASWSTAIQFVVAGVVVALCALHAGWLRAEASDRSRARDAVRSSGASWTLVWSVALAAVALLNGLLSMVPTGPATELLLLGRFVALGASVTLSLPAIQAFAGGPQVHRLTGAVAAWYVAATVLWTTTDLVYAHQVVDGLPQYGTWATVVDLGPVVLLGAYVAHVVQVHRLTVLGALVMVSGFGSATLLIASSIPPPSTLSELFKGVWALPVVIGLQVLASKRIAAVRRAASRRARMRDTLAAVTNAAWLARTPEQVLERALVECRAVLDEPAVEGSLRPLSRDRFVTELYLPVERMDADERGFLDDLARVVSAAAERHALGERLRRTAFVDSLTGLPNRAALDRDLADALDEAERAGHSLAVLLCDLDGLKHGNDRHGHAWGDRVLVRTADHLATTTGGYVGRLGGDEFVVLVTEAPAPSDLRRMAAALRDGLADGDAQPRLSIGIATWLPGEPRDPEALLRDADLALIESKRAHSGLAFFDDRMRAGVAARAHAREDLEKALAAGQIIAHFQPLTDALTLETVSLEVLARWQDGERLRPPAEWLTLAEDTGLILEVGRQMFIAARTGMERFGLPVAVNVAARQLDEPDFVRHVEQSWGTDRWDRLTIEVTESALLYDAQHVRASLAELAARGVKIALDDFGTGYNSLSRLGELPLHVLKIDRTFVQDIGSAEGAAVLRAILALAAAHGLDVVAEGVEHRSELAALISMGVVTVQGHMLGRPAAGLPSRRRVAAPTQREPQPIGAPRPIGAAQPIG